MTSPATMEPRESVPQDSSNDQPDVKENPFWHALPEEEKSNFGSSYNKKLQTKYQQLITELSYMDYLNTVIMILTVTLLGLTIYNFTNWRQLTYCIRGGNLSARRVVVEFMQLSDGEKQAVLHFMATGEFPLI